MLLGNSLKFGNSSGQTDYLLLLFSWHWFLPVQLLSQNVARLHEEAAAKSITMLIPARWHRWKDLVVQLRRSFATWGMEEMQKKAKPPDVINLLLLYNIYLEQFTQWWALLGVTGGTGTWCRAGMSRTSSPHRDERITLVEICRSQLLGQNTNQRHPLACRSPLLSVEEHRFWSLATEN